MTTENNQIKSWILPKPINIDRINNCQINYTLQKVLCRRGFNLEEELDDFLIPSELPNPEVHFSELNKATKRIIQACKKSEQIAICGDYDADGITSTVLLVDLLNKLGAKALPFIPSRQDDGYGLNIKMINQINLKEIKLIITVDNGVSAFDSIKKAKELGIDLVITDHHKIPNKKIDVFSLIHPEKSPKDSPYKYLAGVGIAYMLARNICSKFNYNIDHTSANELFCIGTVADMAPLVGANRKWLKYCLPKIKTTTNLGLKTIIKKLYLDENEITTDDIAYKIAPLINAVGRINDPKIIINLLTNSSENSIKQLTKECFKINNQRKIITASIENDAMKIASNEFANNKLFLVIVNREWHPGIIGIVAARIVEKYNLPTALLSLANDGKFRGSIRSNKILKVNSALDECTEILEAHGGHKDAAGFTIKEENIPYLKERLNNIAIREMSGSNLNKSIKPDAYLSLKDINYDFYNQLILIGPYGIRNTTPIFWTRKCRVSKTYNIKGKHLKMTLDDGTGFIDAIKWNFSTQIKSNDIIDIAYHIEKNNWKNKNQLQLNLIDIKRYCETIDLQLHNRKYKCKLKTNNSVQITNMKGKSISSDLLNYSKIKNIKQELFAKKIISFAEIALGRAS